MQTNEVYHASNCLFSYDVGYIYMAIPYNAISMNMASVGVPKHDLQYLAVLA